MSPWYIAFINKKGIWTATRENWGISHPFSEAVPMSHSRTRRRPRSRRPDTVQKPRGTFHPRVQKVGPEHCGIVAVDCAKARSKWMLADFFGTLLIAPTIVEHRRPALDATIEQLRHAKKRRAKKRGREPFQPCRIRKGSRLVYFNCRLRK